MNETLLQYLWRYGLINPIGLKTTGGDEVTIIHPGKINTNAGPDFIEARIRIGNTLWVGNVELHLHTSDWVKHRHQHDSAYQNIILHVVYQSDQEPVSPVFPELELHQHIDPEVVERYRHLIGGQQAIACSGSLHRVPEIVWSNWLERLLAERWEQRTDDWYRAQDAPGDWRSLLYHRLAANFGFHVNRDAFLQLSRSIPLNILSRHSNSLLQLEALLFGQAGLLPDNNQDEYVKQLEQEYHFLRRKYGLEPMPAHLWKFMRMRPANFPTIRIAQFAALMHQSEALFSKMMETTSVAALKPYLKVCAGTYWNNHYRFGIVTQDAAPRYLGDAAIENILINTVAPMQYFYAKQQGKTELHENSLHLLQSLPPENNNIIREWKGLGRAPEDAAQSQALLQLFNHYCSERQCLNCAAGNYIMKQ